MRIEVEIMPPAYRDFVCEGKEFRVRTSTSIKIDNPPLPEDKYPKPGTVVVVLRGEGHSVTPGKYVVTKLTQFLPPLIYRELGQDHIVIDLEPVTSNLETRLGVIADPELVGCMRWKKRRSGESYRDGRRQK